MATVNQSKIFEQFLPQTHRYRGKVLSVDNAMNRAHVEHGASREWVISTIDLVIDEQVMVENGTVIRKLPDLPYSALEIS